jgi:hypothetical protein
VIEASRYLGDVAVEPGDDRRKRAILRRTVAELATRVVSPAFDASAACQRARMIRPRGESRDAY